MLDLGERPAVGSRPWLGHYDPGVPATLDTPRAAPEKPSPTPWKEAFRWVAV